MLEKKLASSIIMVKGKHFGFNFQTAKDNVFQNENEVPSNKVLGLARKEFDSMVDQLINKNIEVLTFDPIYPEGVVTPDAIFPNNWFVTTPQGYLYIFPMSTENRRQEREADQLVELLNRRGYDIRQLSWVGSPVESSKILEGTGAMILDHTEKSIYAGLSQRCDVDQLNNFADISGYQVAASFPTHGFTGDPVYHTNVLMSVGQKFAVVCFDSIDESHRASLTEKLENSNKEIISINMEQMYSMCGNILQLETRNGDPVIVMSKSAYNGFSKIQIELLERNGELAVCPISVIESIGGGSCRCMIAENFLPKL
ncbi:hypothetical protein IMCC1989_987 [gamma proteobacterium IMCC1989]|nr:hypothetical protein IMCC1989_987 [gamma proteobacterium IMCC1989]